ncbi:MAG: hypothetical protein ABI315_11830 [Bacteroidia bacterium]
MLHYLGKSKILFFCLMLTAKFLTAQLSFIQTEQLWIKADEAFDNGDYFNALKMYEQLNAKDSTSSELNYKMGACNFEIKSYRNKAKIYFDKVDLRKNNETNYYLGKLSHLHGDYEKAIFYFNQYNHSKKINQHTIKEVDDLIAKSNTAINFEATKNNTIKIENLGEKINTPYSEYAPLIAISEDNLIFTARRPNNLHVNKDPLDEYFEDVYLSKKINETWQLPILLDTTINTPLHDGCTGLSADGKKILLYRTNADLKSGDIYESNLDSTYVSTPVIINTQLNSKKYLETSACYSPDNNTVFFSSNRPGGYGGKDLYFMKKLPNGKWGLPFNLGPNINTEYNEDAPFIHPADNVLFFCSEGHVNMGGYDIFKSNFNEEGQFTIPENIGYPINTNDDDIFFVLNANATDGYFSSDRTGGFGLQDIYKVSFSDPLPLNVYHAIVVDENNEVLPKAEITLSDIDSHKIIGTYKTNTTSEKILIIAAPNKTYSITVTAENYIPYQTTLFLNAAANLRYQLNQRVK